MDPVLVISGMSAMMAALGVWQRERDYLLTKETHARVLRESQSNPDILNEARLVASLLPERTLDLLGSRVKACWEEFDRAISPGGGVIDPASAEPKLEKCICSELRSIKRLNGSIPSGKMREWWNHYGCGPYIA